VNTKREKNSSIIRNEAAVVAEYRGVFAVQGIQHVIRKNYVEEPSSENFTIQKSTTARPLA
jgi:hypothetical protein